MNLGIIVRMDKTGLGNQTRDLAIMLKPKKVMLINSQSFNKNEQHPENYIGIPKQIVKGFPSPQEISTFLNGLDAVLTCELFYSPRFIDMARIRGIKTYNQYNYEFFDNFINPRLSLPTLLISPSKWHLSKMSKDFGAQYLPPPVIASRYEKIACINLARGDKKIPKLLHIVGRQAIHDRNGTDDLLSSLKHTDANFTLVIKIQSGSALQEGCDDPRVVFDNSNPDNEEDLYKDFDALILPRRYAGLCLPMNEALMSALPVIMTDIDPNNKILPSEWLVKSDLKGSFKARTEINIYSARPKELAKRLDWICTTDILKEKEKARAMGLANYSDTALLPKYKALLGLD